LVRCDPFPPRTKGLLCPQGPIRAAPPETILDASKKAAPARFLDDGRICLSNNAAERGVRGIALGRKSWLFCRSDRGGEGAAVTYSLIVTAKMNDIDPQAWLADVLARVAEHPVQRLDGQTAAVELALRHPER
jgi:hypothetical protein